MNHRELAALLLALAWLLTTWTSQAQEPEVPEATTASIFFATNREQMEVADPELVRFGGEQGSPSFGICEAEFKPIPILDDVAPKVPFYVPSETTTMRIDVQEDPEVHWERLSEAVDGTSTGSIVVFVHGYSYDLERGCRRAVEIQRALEGEATVLLLSWPSNGDPTDYAADVEDLVSSVPFLVQTLQQLSDRFGSENVHVLSHSLGARGMMLTLDVLEARSAAQPVVNRWVLLAPDIDSQTFLEILPRLEPMAESITLYASSNDTPLKVSRRLNGAPRLGEAGEFLTVAPGVESIDVSPAGRYQILGHEYFFFHPAVAADLELLLSTGQSAAERPGLRSETLNDLTYWEISEEDGP
jgi:esterase/lipase superfamily enzyme